MGRGRRVNRTMLTVTAALLIAGCTTQPPGRPGPTSTGLPSSVSSESRTTRPATTTVARTTRSTASSSEAPSSSASSSAPRTTPTTTRAPLGPVPGTSVKLPSGVAEEASGLTPAGAGGTTFWTVDDATGTDSVIAVDATGRQLGTLRVDGMSAGNAEAISSAACTTGSAQRCLFVGDLGDHSGRDDVKIYRIPEPASAIGDHSTVGTTWRYTYADGPRNAESLFIAPDGSVVVIDKPLRAEDGSVRAHHLYRGPPGGGVLALVGTFVPPEPALPLQSRFEGNVVTDAALQVGPVRTRVLVQFYDQVLQYTAPQRAADPALFFRWPHVALVDPDLIQAEGIAPLPDGCGFATISEAGPGGSAARLSIAPCG